MLKLLIFSICISGLGAVLYDCFLSKPATRTRIRVYRQRNNTEYCLIAVNLPCDVNEWRRVDGSCNNLKFPSMGMPRTPTIRILSTNFSIDYEPRKAADGRDLPLARYLRTQLLKEGKTSDLSHTQLMSLFILFVANDFASFNDNANYVVNTTTCCQPEGVSNYICSPNKIPIDDPVHRYSGIRCQNLTKPQSFQYFGCSDFGTTPFTRMITSTTIFDMANVYGKELGIINELRTYSNGLLKTEEDHGMLFPPQNSNLDPKVNLCLLNQPPLETRCHKYHINGVFGGNFFTILMYRLHNYIADQLAQMNPCWDDERLFNTAKDINIAIYLQIYYYELLPILLGKENLLRDGVLSSSDDFRDLYNEDVKPQLTDEFVYVNRWFHTIQEADLKLYDPEGYYLKTIPIVNITTRTGFLPLDNNLAKITQGSFRQPGGRSDHTIDYDLTERAFGGLQFASDVAMNDLQKGRLSGFQPYVKYREYCAGKSYNTFESLRDVMSKERIYRLTQVYKDIEDVDLMAGIWVENRIPGGIVPHTVYCLLVEHLKHVLASDRHWYERPNRPHAFTLDQLLAIRRATIAGVLCAVGDSVTKIQPKAFFTISSCNPLIDCSSSKIGTIDLSSWQDFSCPIES